MAGCAGPRQAAGPEPNVEVVVHESVDGPEQDWMAQAKVFFNGEPAGMTESAAKSAEKKWLGRLPPGNHLLRLEYMYLRDLGEWTSVAEDAQPRERFVRVEAGRRTRVEVKFFDQGRKNQISVSRD